MAVISALYPLIAKRAEKDGNITYSEAMFLGKLIQTTINPTISKVELYGDGTVAEADNTVSSAAVGLNTSTVPLASMPIIYGCTVTDNEDGTSDVSFKTEDNGQYVGYGFIHQEQVDGVRTYNVTWLPKVQFSLPNETYNTKGQTITFNTPSLSATAYQQSVDNTEWKHEVRGFKTLTEALKKLKALGGTAE